MVEEHGILAKVISSSKKEYDEGTRIGKKICEIVLTSHVMFYEWLVSCQFTTLDAKYEVKRILAGSYRFTGDEYIYEVTVRKLTGFLKRKDTVMVLVTRKEG